MRYYPDRKQAQEIDRYTREVIGIPGIVLMERAAMRLAIRIADACKAIKGFDKKRDKILAVTECGNNGGDAVAAARLLKCEGYDTYVYEIGCLKDKSGSYLKQAEIAKNLSVKFIGQEDHAQADDTADLFAGFRIIIDGIFGVGLNRDVSGIHRSVIESINTARDRAGCFVAACDIPSGISSDTGRIMGSAVKCDMTVTFQYIKYGCLINEGRLYSGKIYCEDIGLFVSQSPGVMTDILKDTGSQYLYYEYDDDEVSDILPKRAADSNKGSCGKVLIVAGSKDIYGALYMCTGACLKSGAGLVKVVSDIANRDLLMDKLPEAMMLAYDIDNAGEAFDKEYEKAIDWADVILAGPGLGTGAFSRHLITELADKCRGGQSIVLDADALNIIAQEDTHEILTKLKDKTGYEHVAVTPHMGEMVRLLKHETDIAEIKDNMAQTASRYADDNGIICILKDARTVIGCTGPATGIRPVYVNTTGNSGMAKGGSGDVLAGIVAGLLAQNKDEQQTNYSLCCAAVNLHGRAGDAAADAAGERGMLAGDIIEAIVSV